MPTQTLSPCSLPTISGPPARRRLLGLCSLASAFGLLASAHAASTVLLRDTFDANTPNTTDLNVDIARQSGTLAPITYSLANGPGHYGHQLQNGAAPDQLLVADFPNSTSSLNFNFRGLNSAGGLIISFDLDSMPTSYGGTPDNWGCVNLGMSQADQMANVNQGVPHFGILFRAAGTLQAFDAGTVVNPNPEPTYTSRGPGTTNHIDLVITDTDGNPFDGSGNTTIDVYVNGGATPVWSYTKVGGYADNFINVQGSFRAHFDNLVVARRVPDIANPSFEADNFTVFPGYVSGNGPITGWTSPGGHGVNPGTFGGPFTDNGTIPDGTKAAFLQEDAALRQTITGLGVGVSYQIKFFENSRNCCSGTAPFCEVKIGDNTIVLPHAVPPVGGSNPYRQVTSEAFTATSSSMELAFIKSNPQGGDTTLLIDNVTIQDAVTRVPVPGLFNSGVDNNGVVLADNSVDSHWTLVVNADGPSTDAIVEDSTAFPLGAGGPWAANDAGSKWIGPRFNTAAAAGLARGNGTYVYRTTFDLTSIDVNTVVITGSWGVDNNGVAIRVNGVATGIVNNNGFASLTAFTINSQNATFVAGLNTLEFEVQNVDAVEGYTGIRIANLRGQAERPGTPPSIVTQPQTQVAAPGDTVTFKVVAGGSSPLSYQWRKGGADLPGQTTPTLTLSSITTADAGNYSVKISNAAGNVTSTEATLLVLQPIAGVFNTGVDSSGAALADGLLDPHYRLVVNPDSASSDAIVEDSTLFPIVAGPWVANSADSKWVGPRKDTALAAGAVGAGGDYTYRLIVDVTGYDPATIWVTGEWATDNEGQDITINGTSTGQKNTTQFTGYTAFVVNSGFVAGANQLEFKLNNSDIGWTGLRVRNIRALGQPANTCPQAPAQSVTLNEDTSAPVVLAATDVDGDSLTYTLLTNPAHGTLSGTPPNLTYTPAHNFCGADGFTYKVNDGTCDSAVGTVTLNVTCVNENPVAVIEVSPTIVLASPSPNLFVLSVNNSNACVTLDGSKSSDEEPGALTYAWLLDGSSVPVATGAVVPVCLELGLHQVTLLVTDGSGGSGSAQVTVEVITGSEAIDDLIESVDNADLERKNKRPFVATLKAVSASFDRGNLESARGQLHAFQNKVRAQVAKTDPALALEWIRAAQSIIDALPE